ncbi:MAG: hypothetical protein QW702_03150 [Candidatus Bathyarchaeia archaeon]
MESLKREFLELLDKDLEFRYAVAGYLGLSEILKRLDTLAEEQVRLAKEQIELRREQAKLAEEQVKLREEQTKIWTEMRALREEQAKIWTEIKALREEQTKIWMEIARLREEQTKIWTEISGLREEQTRIWAEIKALREEQTKIWAEIAGLREDFNKMREDFNRMYRQLDIRLTRVERTLEKITLDIEEEARIIVKYRLREMGYEVEVGSLILPEAEINIYGASDEICVIGEASVRAPANIVDKINSNLEKLRTLYPDTLRPKILKVVYTSLAMPDLIERAEKEGIWVLKATGDIVKPKNL